VGLDTVEFLLYAEKELGIKITDEDEGNIYTVGEFSALCCSKLQLQLTNDLNEEQVFFRLKQILRKHFVNSDVEITRKHLIVKDLGLD
jgi:acyl carrier protein